MDKQELVKQFPKIRDVEISNHYVMLCLSQKLFRYEPKVILPLFDYLKEQGYTLKIFDGDIGHITIIFENEQKQTN